MTKSATSISVTCCEHGTITIHLHDRDEAIFATASMGPESAVAFMDDLGDKVLTALQAHTSVGCRGAH